MVISTEKNIYFKLMDVSQFKTNWKTTRKDPNCYVMYLRKYCLQMQEVFGNTVQFSLHK